VVSAAAAAGTSNDGVVVVDCKNENAELGAASTDKDAFALPIPDAKNENALPEDGADVAAGAFSVFSGSCFLSLLLLLVPFRSRPPNMIAAKYKSSYKILETVILQAWCCFYSLWIEDEMKITGEIVDSFIRSVIHHGSFSYRTEKNYGQ
jgi:hypothetical protein